MANVTEDERLGITIKRFRKDTLSRFLPSRDLRKFITSHRSDYDLVLLNGMFNPELIGLAFFLQRVGLPYVVCSHGRYHVEMLKVTRSPEKVLYSTQRFMLNNSAAIQIFSLEHIADLERFGVYKRAFAVPNGF